MGEPLPSRHCRVRKTLFPHAYEVLWMLAVVTEQQPDALASEVYGEGFARGRPDYQKWSPRKVATVLGSLRERGLVSNSARTDDALAGRQTRRWWITDKGWTVLNP